MIIWIKQTHTPNCDTNNRWAPPNKMLIRYNPKYWQDKKQFAKELFPPPPQPREVLHATILDIARILRFRQPKKLQVPTNPKI